MGADEEVELVLITKLALAMAAMHERERSFLAAIVSVVVGNIRNDYYCRGQIDRV